MAIATTSSDADAPTLYRTRHEPDGSEPISRSIYTALAAVEGVAPSDLDVRLYDCVDVEAIEDLYRTSADSEWEFAFTVERYAVRVRADGTIAVSSAE
ncbi:HalOD1 output domain-containing protein [Halorussus pelagicus]|uniref:HalOD1 output domain-containing protein n=1 Tax=Halorussus pelagicus TaxID=2505977 RepID=UPI000FFBF6D6|nr:HalOD1 output domain-containing protein [Halorussus pelagicus]